MYFYQVYIGLFGTSNKTKTAQQRVDIFNDNALNSAILKPFIETAKQRKKKRTTPQQDLVAYLRNTIDYRIGRIQIEWDMIETQTTSGLSGAFEVSPVYATASCEIGILRLYRGQKDHSLKEKEQELPAVSDVIEERPRILAVLAVPGYMTPTDFLSFAGTFRDGIEHVRVIRDSRSASHYMILIKFANDSQATADEFYQYYNGKTFSPLEPEICHIVYVSSVECEYREIMATSSNRVAGSLDERIQTDPSDLFLNTQKVLVSSATNEELVELPTCPVCLERLDTQVSGLLTILCQHTFHCKCLERWGDGSCPVCRYTQTSPFVDQEQFQKTLAQIKLEDKENEQTTSSSLSAQQTSTMNSPSSSSPKKEKEESKCHICDRTHNLWICLVCGVIGCGRYASGHAKEHFSQTHHPYAMELETQCVWDYAGDGYVHRLVQSMADRKVIALDRPSGNMTRQQTTGAEAAAIAGGGVSGMAESSFIDAREKLDAVAQEYDILLTSQLESQREYYELQIARLRHQQSQRPERQIELERQVSESRAKCQELEQLIKLQTSEMENGRKQRDEEQREWDREKQKLQANVARWVKKSTEDAQLLKEEKELTKQMLDNQEQLKQQIRKLQETSEGLQEQVRDLTFFISAQKAIQENEDTTRGTGELQGGSVVGVAEAPSLTKKKKGKQRRR